MENATQIKTLFGEILCELRTKSNFTQEQLADACGSARNYIGELERAEKQPSLSTLFALAEALGTTPAAMMKTMQKRLDK